MSNPTAEWSDSPLDEMLPAVNVPALRTLLQTQADIAIAVSTGESRRQQVDTRWERDTRALNHGFRRLGLQPPFPWRSLSEWYGFYSANLVSYRDRRAYVQELASKARAELDAAEARGGIHDPAMGGGDPSWENLNVRIAGLVAEYSAARDRDGWQDVGRRSREILIDFGKLVASDDVVPAGETPPKAGDAKAWFMLFLARYASGSARAELRSMMRATWDLAQKVTHSDIDDVDAFAAAQACVLLVRTAQKMQRDAK